MSLTESRLTRTSASTGAEGRTHVTSTAVTSSRRGRSLVRAVMWWSGVWSAITRGASAAATWSARTVRPAGVLVVVAATVGLGLGIAFGWVEWMVAGAAALVLVAASVPSSSARGRMTSTCRSRTSASWPETA
jgi:hypothetical protein